MTMKLHAFLTKLGEMPVYTDFELMPTYDEVTVLCVRLHTYSIHAKFGCVVNLQADGTIDDEAAKRAFDEVMKAADDAAVVRSDRKPADPAAANA